MKDERDIFGRKKLSADQLTRFAEEASEVFFDSFDHLASSYVEKLSNGGSAGLQPKTLKPDLMRWLDLYLSLQEARVAGELDRACILAFHVGEQYEAIQRRYRDLPGMKASQEHLASRGLQFNKREGETQKTKDRREFLTKIKSDVGSITQDALAEHIIENHASKARRLWGVSGQSWKENLRRKLRDFIKNKRV